MILGVGELVEAEQGHGSAFPKPPEQPPHCAYHARTQPRGGRVVESATLTLGPV